jgi:large subunit ribosomal protein L23
MALFGTKKTDPKNTKAVNSKPAAKAVEKKAEAVSMQDLYSGAATTVTKTKGSKTTAAAAKKSEAHRVLVSPLVTEKATVLSEHNKYVFIVSTSANKIAIAKAIHDVYGVKPVAVNIANVSGKKVARGRIKGVRSDWRKAIVTLKKGETIKIYEGV